MVFYVIGDIVNLIVFLELFFMLINSMLSTNHCRRSARWLINPPTGGRNFFQSAVGLAVNPPGLKRYGFSLEESHEAVPF